MAESWAVEYRLPMAKRRVGALIEIAQEAGDPGFGKRHSVSEAVSKARSVDYVLPFGACFGTRS